MFTELPKLADLLKAGPAVALFRPLLMLLGVSSTGILCYYQYKWLSKPADAGLSIWPPVEGASSGSYVPNWSVTGIRASFFSSCCVASPVPTLYWFLVYLSALFYCLDPLDAPLILPIALGPVKVFLLLSAPIPRPILAWLKPWLGLPARFVELELLNL